MRTEKIIISSNDIDANLNLRLAAFFRIMQDVIMHDSEEHGFGSSDLMKINVLWVITRVQVEIHRMPKYQEEVIAKTYAGKDMKIYYPRYFRLESKSGELLVNLSSVWVLIDKETRKPLWNCPFQEKLYENHLPDELPLPGKVEQVPTELIEKRKIHYSDVDLNNHLNNTRYIELLSDVHSSEDHLRHPIKKLTINYLKEIKENQIVEVSSNFDNPEIIEVKSDGVTNFVAEIEY